MSITVEGNKNYAATVVKVHALEPLEGLDNLVALRVLGFQALVPKDTPLGSLMVVFGAETQLSQAFAAANNLHRHSELNADPEAKGYLEDNRRVKAIKMRGHRSDALAMSLEAVHNWLFNLTGGIVTGFKEGDVFDTIEGHEVCRKYELPVKGQPSQPGIKKVRFNSKCFPEHFDTTRYFGNEHLIPDHAPVVVTQKLHGTSVRFGKIHVNRDLKWYERLAKKVGIPVQDTEPAFVVGSRRVTKSIKGESKTGDHWYSEGDIFTESVAEFEDRIPVGFLVFAEIIGYTPQGQPIQPKYTYDLSAPDHAVYVYRVATVNEDGIVVDLPWEAVKQFTRERGMYYVPELDRLRHWEFDPEGWVDGAFTALGYENAVPLSDAGTVDEGVCVRWDGGITPTVLKAKSPIFLGHETKMLDAEAVDIEAQEG